jgi:dolichol-phosphate mannosyltransferase
VGTPAEILSEVARHHSLTQEELLRRLFGCGPGELAGPGPGSMILIGLPVYNEEEALARLLPDIATAMEEARLAYRVLVVEDGSTDRTVEVAQGFRERLHLLLITNPERLGLGVAMQTLFRAALAELGDGDVLITMDADETHRPELIGPLVQKIHEGADVVIASRFQPGARMIGMPPHRRLMSCGVAWLFRTLAPVRGVKDYSCGYRAFSAEIVRRAAAVYGEGLTDQAGFSCEVDILVKLGRLGAVVAEVPMILRYDRKPGKSKMNLRRTVRDTLRVLGRSRAAKGQADRGK